MLTKSRVLLFLILLFSQGLPSKVPATEAHFVFGPDGSKIWFDADAVLHTFQGIAKKFRGTIDFKDSDDPTNGQVLVEVEADSLETGISQRDEIMKKSHLEVENYPLMILKVDRVGKEGVGQVPGVITMKASGELLIHGVKRPIDFFFDLIREKSLIKAQGNFTVKMSDFKVKRPAFLFIRVRDEVKVFFEIVAESKTGN